MAKLYPAASIGAVQPDEYLRMAAVEDGMWYYRALHVHIERALIPACGDRAVEILDAGCGTGGLIRRLEARHRAWRWTGVDLEPVACEMARRRSAAHIVQASVTELPFPDESFDAVVSADVLYHLDDDRAALDEYRRVLAPGGALIINVPAHPWLWSYHDETVHTKRRYRRAELRGKLEASGFERLRLTHWNAFPLPLIVFRRKLLPPPATRSDVRLYPRPVEAALGAAMAVERAWIGAGGTWPVGSSLFALAVKPPAAGSASPR